MLIFVVKLSRDMASVSLDRSGFGNFDPTQVVPATVPPPPDATVPSETPTAADMPSIEHSESQAGGDRTLAPWDPEVSGHVTPKTFSGMSSIAVDDICQYRCPF